MWTRILKNSYLLSSGSPISSIEIELFNNETLSRVHMYLNDSVAYTSLISALRKMREFESSESILINVTDFKRFGENYLRFDITNVTKEKFENMFALLQHYSNVTIPSEFFNKMFADIFPAAPVIVKGISKRKIAGTVLATAATAGLLLWGCRAATNYLTTEDINNQPDNELESSQPTLFNSFEFGPE